MSRSLRPGMRAVVLGEISTSCQWTVSRRKLPRAIAEKSSWILAFKENRHTASTSESALVSARITFWSGFEATTFAYIETSILTTEKS